jgi:hypothetical protein
MWIIKYFAVLIIAVSAACGSERASSVAANKPAAQSPDSAGSPEFRMPGPNAAANAPAREAGAGSQQKPANPVAADDTLSKTDASKTDTTPTDRKIVRNADLSLEADVPEDAQQKITAIAENTGGFVVESQQSSSDVKVTTRDVVTMTVRVPAAKFSEALGEIRKTASRVIVETVKGTDVTEEFVDIEARLKAKRALEQQFIEIMKRANSVEDALRVQTELGRVRAEIEQIEGRKRYLENQSSLSTIKVRIQTPAAFSNSSVGFFYRLGQSLSTGFDFAVSFVLGLITVLIAILPFVLLIVVPAFYLFRYLIRRMMKRKTPEETIKEEV